MVGSHKSRLLLVPFAFGKSLFVHSIERPLPLQAHWCSRCCPILLQESQQKNATPLVGEANTFIGRQVLAVLSVLRLCFTINSFTNELCFSFTWRCRDGVLKVPTNQFVKHSIEIPSFRTSLQSIYAYIAKKVSRMF